MDIGTGKIRQRYEMQFKQRNNWITSAAFSSDGKTVVTSFSLGKILLWDVASGEILRTYQEQGAEVSSVVFTNNGKMILSGSQDGTLKAWASATGELLYTLRLLNHGNDWLAITPDGFFDGSPGGLERVKYRIGEKLNVQHDPKLFKQFHKPGLLAEMSKRFGIRPSMKMKTERETQPPEDR